MPGSQDKNGSVAHAPDSVDGVKIAMFCEGDSAEERYGNCALIWY